VGAGLSPGDDSYGEPYFYVSPHPTPPADCLGKLASGRWHTTGWTGAVLTATDILSRSGESESSVTEFVDAAVEACRRAIG
jgi:hypothetical protein